MTSSEKVDNFIEHHGIKGQKWGVRRFQNEDGSYTKAGRERYNKKVDKAYNKLSKIYSKEFKRRAAGDNTTVKAEKALSKARTSKFIPEFWDERARSKISKAYDYYEIANQYQQKGYKLAQKIKRKYGDTNLDDIDPLTRSIGERYMKMTVNDISEMSNNTTRYLNRNMAKLETRNKFEQTYDPNFYYPYDDDWQV